MKQSIKELFIGVLALIVAGVGVFAYAQGYPPAAAQLRYNGGDGTAALPAYSFSADPDTGLYRTGSNSIAMVTNGAEMQRWSSTLNIFSADVRVNNGYDVQVAGGRNVTTWSDGALKINGAMTASTATSSIAPVLITQLATLDANDLVMDVQRWDGLSMWSVDREGDSLNQGNIGIVGSSSYLYNVNGAVLVNDSDGLNVGNGSGTDADGTINAKYLSLPTNGSLNLDATTNGDTGMLFNGTTLSIRAQGGTPISINAGASTITHAAGYVVITGKIATASLPTCAAGLAGALVYDTTLKKHVSCNDNDGSYTWDPLY